MGAIRGWLVEKDAPVLMSARVGGGERHEEAFLFLFEERLTTCACSQAERNVLWRC